MKHDKAQTEYIQQKNAAGLVSADEKSKHAPAYSLCSAFYSFLRVLL